MSRRLLIIESDELVASHLARAFRGAGYDIQLSPGATDSVALIGESPPDCIVCDLELEDIDGGFVGRRVRGHESAQVSRMPLVFLVPAGDLEAHVRALRVGGDAVITKPVSDVVAVSQMEALLAMSARLTARRDSLVPMSAPGPPALRGDLEQMSLATVLMVIEMDRRSGRLHVEGPDEQHATFSLEEGTFVVAMIDRKPFDAVVALRRALEWKSGKFWFSPSESRGNANPRGTIQGTLLEAMRQIDEAAR